MWKTIVSLLAAASVVNAGSPFVDLGYSKYEGVRDNGVLKWLGMRYADKPTGNNRFAAPQDPPKSEEVIKADKTCSQEKFGAICPPQTPDDYTVQGKTDRFRVDEDCLYISVFAPENPKRTRLPVMFFIQGGSFKSNSNSNWNPENLVKDGEIIVVLFNYRVGPTGFAHSDEVKRKGALNAGILDIKKALEWTKDHIAAFGGDSDQIVLNGISAGGTASALLMVVYRDAKRPPFAGAIIESGGWVTMRNMEQGEEQYECLLNATKCTDNIDTLACLRSKPEQELRTTGCWFDPGIDDQMFPKPLLDMFSDGAFAKVPTIMGFCNNEGTKHAAPQDTDTAEQAHTYLKKQDGALTRGSLDILDDLYIDRPAPYYPKSGRKWRQTADAIGDIGTNCIVYELQNSIVKNAVAPPRGSSSGDLSPPTWNYRYAVTDEDDENAGYGTWHIVEQYALWGPNNTDNRAPPSYLPKGANEGIAPVIRKYWLSFVKQLDPNQERDAGSPEWKTWSGAEDGQRQRLVFITGKTKMERMSQRRSLSCRATREMSVALGHPREGSQTTDLDGKLARDAKGASDSMDY
ncbi:triacylglycerol lipase-like protein [Phyllosticta citrichinensis]